MGFLIARGEDLRDLHSETTICQNQVIWFQVFQKATFLKDSNIINITLEQIRNKTCSTTGGYSNETLKCVGLLIARESVSLTGKIPVAFHSKFSRINNTAYVVHGFEYLREEPAKLGSLWKQSFACL